MPTFASKHGIWIFIFACLGAVGGLLPGQVNPAAADTPAAKRAQLVSAAYAQIGVTTAYDPAYTKLAYPGGDVPADRGVCTDVVIRALRKVNVDLQVLVHDDIARVPQAYPHDWPGPVPDANIDHRRVPNLMVYLQREGRQLPLTRVETDYLPGDIVVWRLPSGQLHVGIVTDRIVAGTRRPMMVHNIGQGAQCEDVLFQFTPVAHYRWFV
jgi:uncharacterized protein YijF (DUF1287 family)